ncbi:efflux RND transporter periplasmic adaptor subunit [Robertmurraya kyonggiensis]|uniref:HlyD family efflux transporter periplasmic adaptor subunit n=1 Tax=Robertmurraya kyonggiensis TaxID=1037680 RepID=A0A4U1D9V6_9BACI|nr:HlyD family efflux transporter periplasmic adaptor subunit [Robertmurraya kyonggiensis]TKC18327.1 HlyD family efflux transporter periplasmic adaptor subunit [Robertmurraya kyonggiensis]
MDIKQNKKSKKKVVIFSIVGLLIIFLVTSLLFPQNDYGDYEEENVEKGDITTYYSFSGSVDAKSRQNVISTKEMHIEEVLVRVGDQVKKDDVLFINSDGEKTRAEIDGEVSKVNIKSNSHALKGSQLIDIVNYSDLHVSVKVDEYDLKYVAVDQEVNVTINALEKEIKGKVYAISKEATNENGISYFTAMIDINKDEKIRVGMSAETRILKDDVKGVPTVSLKAIQFDSKNKPYVLKVSEKGEPIKKYVQAGINDGTTIEINNGISIGDKVMIPKTFNQDSGAEMMHGGGEK